MIVFQVSLDFDPVKEILKTMSNLYFNEESDYSEKNTCHNKVFRSTILRTFQFEPEQEKNMR